MRNSVCVCVAASVCVSGLQDVASVVCAQTPRHWSQNYREPFSFTRPPLCGGDSPSYPLWPLPSILSGLGTEVSLQAVLSAQEGHKGDPRNTNLGERHHQARHMLHFLLVIGGAPRHRSCTRPQLTPGVIGRGSPHRPPPHKNHLVHVCRSICPLRPKDLGVIVQGLSLWDNSERIKHAPI